jgi:tetratricopeptide (TPR) repeat protein
LIFAFAVELAICFHTIIHCAMQPKQNLRLNVWICLGLGLITFALYLPTVRHEFIQFDDQQYVTENLHVQAGLSSSGIRWAFGFHASNWHPLTWLSHMLDCQLYGLNPAGHHLTNLLLHTANTLLLFLALLRLTGKTWHCAAVAALFGWHPLHVESVAWVSERKDVLCACFWMLTLHAYARYASHQSFARYATALGFYILALMAKPMAVTLPFVLLLLDYWPLRRLHNKRWPALLWEKTPFFLATAGACVLTVLAQEQAIVSTAGLTLLQRIEHAVAAYAHYIGAMFFPFNLAVYYPYEVVLPTSVVWASALLLISISLLAIWKVRQQPYLLIGWLWYLGTLVPVIGFVQVGDQAWADRYTYLPLIGLFIAFVWLAEKLFSTKARLCVALSGTTAVILLALTAQQLAYWKNSRTLFERTAKVTTDNFMAVTLLGSLLSQEGRVDEAIEYFQRAMRYKPGYPEAHFFLGHAYDQQGKLDEALVEYQKALRAKPIQEQTHIFMAIVLAKQNKLEAAINHYQEALKLNPDSAVPHNNLARIYQTLGRTTEAVEHYEAALRINPKLAIAHNNLGVILLQRDLGRGTLHLREALKLKPDNGETQFNLALALNQQRQWSEAAELFKKTLPEHLNDPKARYQFALALAHLNRSREAMSEYAAALLLQPDFPEALDGLSWILATDSNASLRNGAQAVAMAEQACTLTKRQAPKMLITLAAAYAEVGRFEQAINTLQEARTNALNLKQPDLVTECDRLLAPFRRGESWRTR